MAHLRAHKRSFSTSISFRCDLLLTPRALFVDEQMPQRQGDIKTSGAAKGSGNGKYFGCLLKFVLQHTYLVKLSRNLLLKIEPPLEQRCSTITNPATQLKDLGFTAA